MFKKVLMPVTLEKFDELVGKLCKSYKFTDENHVAAVISVAIRHLPNDQAYTTYDYLANCVYKSMANHVANYKSELVRHSAQVDVLVSLLKTDPNNQQAADELQKAADNGSEYAKQQLDKLFPPASIIPS